VISSVSPDSGPVTGGTDITVRGSGFTSGARVEIGEGGGSGPTAVAATDVHVVSATKITATAGRGSRVGTFHVSVTTGAGTSAAQAGDDYSYAPTAAWGFATEITAPGGGGLFYGVSCTNAADCTAVGG
jgi:hypothetical protein